jgi:hypothetical protein
MRASDPMLSGVRMALEQVCRILHVRTRGGVFDISTSRERHYELGESIACLKPDTSGF